MRLLFQTPKLALCVILLLSVSFPTAARDSLTGTWIEEYSETIVSVEQWSPVCGPPPKSTGRRNRGLKFRLDDQGIALKFIGHKKTFSTADCQTDNKAVQPKERTVKKNLFMISCSTPENSNPYENGLYSFRIKSPERIEYRETTRFSRNASNSMCVHTMRKRRMYKKIADEVKGSKLSEEDSASDEGSSTASSPPPSDPCIQPGAAASVFIEPSHLELPPGSKACVETSASDSNACPVKVDLDWDKSATRPKGVRLSDGRCFAVSRKTPPGKYVLRLQAAQVAVPLTLTVTKTREPKVGTAPISLQHDSIRATEENQGNVADAGTTALVDEEAGKSDAQAPDAGVVDDEYKGDKSPKTLQDISPDETKVAVSEQSLPSWVIFTAVGGLALILILVVVMVVFGKRSSKSRVPAKPSKSNDARELVPPPSSTPVTPEPEAAPKPQLVMAPTRVEPLRPVASDRLHPPKSALDSAPSSSPADDSEQQPASAVEQPQTKFCIGCGKSLPVEAKFCPYCAQKQE